MQQFLQPPTVNGVGFLPILLLLGAGGLLAFGAEKVYDEAKQVLTGASGSNPALQTPVTVAPGGQLVQQTQTFGGAMGESVGKGLNTVLLVAAIGGAAYFLFPGAVKRALRRRH